jgi:hypothetical protein
MVRISLPVAADIDVSVPGEISCRLQNACVAAGNISCCQQQRRQLE